MKVYSAALLFGFSAMAASADSFDMAGSVTGMSAATITALGEGHMVMMLPGTHDKFEMDQEDHPLADITGACNGSAEVNGASATGEGHCVYTNAAGDTMVNRWTIDSLGADGAFHGSWVMVGGTGAFADISGGGGFVSATDRAIGVQDVQLSGAITLP